MTVEKFIRILGYVVYSILWLPIIVLLMVVLPITVMIMTRSISYTWMLLKNGLKAGIKHDMEFINTGVWY